MDNSENFNKLVNTGTDRITFYTAIHLKNEPEDFHLLREDGMPAFNFVHFISPVTVVIGKNKIKTEKNACIIYRPKTREEYFSCEGGFVNNFITFMVSDEKLITDYGIPLDKIFYINDENTVTKICEYISWALTDFLVDHTGDLEKHLYMLFQDLSVQVALSRPKNQRLLQTKKRFIEMRTLVEKTPKDWTVEKMAKYVYLTRSHFSVLYSDFFGVSPSEDLISMSLKLGEQLLTKTELSVTQIAAECGYNSVEHFLRQFKKRYGQSPGKYRKQKQIKNTSSNI